MNTTARWSALLLSLSLPLSTAAQGFFDVPSYHENADAINFLRSGGIIAGYPDGTFRPERTVNRAEFTKIIIEATFHDDTINACLTSSFASAFSDVPNNAWFSKYICTARQFNLVEGYADGTFRPAQTINFVEAAKIIVETLASTNSQAAIWFEGYSPAVVDGIWYEGYVNGLSSRNAVPLSISAFDASVTRGQMSEMMYRLIDEQTEKASLTYDNLAGETPPPPHPAASQATSPTPSPSTDAHDEMFRLVNAQRAKVGLPPYRRNAALDDAAQSTPKTCRVATSIAM